VLQQSDLLRGRRGFGDNGLHGQFTATLSAECRAVVIFPTTICASRHNAPGWEPQNPFGFIVRTCSFYESQCRTRSHLGSFPAGPNVKRRYSPEGTVPMVWPTPTALPPL